MTLQQLEYALAVDKFKHFGKAADACFVTQATLSAMIKKLEDELQVVLFDRKSQPIITTDEGREILEEAEKIIAHSRILLDKAQSVHDKIDGTLNIGIIPTIASAFLPLALPKILRSNPRLRLTFREFTTPDIISRLKAGELDAGILATPLHDPALEEEILYYEGLTVYGEIPEHDNKQYLLPDEVAQQKMWLLEEGHCLRAQSINLCKLQKHSLTPLNIDFEGGSFDTLMNMADSFGGLTVIPELYHRFMSPPQQQKLHDFQPPMPVREISVVFHRPYAKLRIINRLAEDIRQIVRPLLKTHSLHSKDMHLVEF